MSPGLSGGTVQGLQAIIAVFRTAFRNRELRRLQLAWAGFNSAMHYLGHNGADRLNLRIARAKRDPPDDIIEQMRNEAFICGVFSLLDRMMKQPFDELLKLVPVSESVRQVLVDGSGRYQPFLEIVRADENESLFDVRDSAERVLLGVGEINRALLRAQAQAMQIH